MKRHRTSAKFFVSVLTVALCFTPHAFADDTGTTYPAVSEELCPVEFIQLTRHASAAVRKPPGDGPFPAIIFMHGGLGHSRPNILKKQLITGPVLARFLAWGYVTVNATRRNINHNPQDRGVIKDTVDIINVIKAMPHVEGDSVVLYGGSGGGTLALEVASHADLAAIAAGEPATIIYMDMFNKSHVVRDENGKITGDKRWDVMNKDPKTLYTPALRAHTRAKIKTIRCPVLILQSDQHAITKFNQDVFIPELKALGIDTTLKVYPGEKHGFYWGYGKDPAKILQATRDADAFFQQHMKTTPEPIDAKHIKATKIPAKR